MTLFGHEDFCATVQGPEGIGCNCRVSDREVPMTASHPENLGMPPKRVVLSSLHETRFGLWALDAHGQVYEVKNEMTVDPAGKLYEWPNPTGRYTLSKVTFVDPKEGK